MNIDFQSKFKFPMISHVDDNTGAQVIGDIYTFDQTCTKVIFHIRSVLAFSPDIPCSPWNPRGPESPYN